MCNIKVIVKDGRASIYTPFNRDFEEEKARLLARIAEIDKLLAE